MKDFLKNCLHYLLLLFPLFIVIFIFSVLFNFMSLSGIDINGQIVSTIIRPCLFFSLYSSFIVSFIIYGILYIKKIKRLVILSFLFPLFITGLTIGLVTFFLQPSLDDAHFLLQKDARLYLTEKSFIRYNHDIPVSLETESYNSLMGSAVDKSQKEVLRSSYITDKNQTRYVLRKDLNLLQKKKLQSVIYSITHRQPIFFYFNRVEKDYVNDLIVIRNKELSYYKRVEAGFENGQLILNLPADPAMGREIANDLYSSSGDLHRYRFIKLEFFNDTVFNILGVKVIYDKYRKALTSFFLYKKSIFSLAMIVILWIVWCFIILSASNMIYIEQYPLMSLAVNVTVFAGIFFLLELLYPLYADLYKYFNIAVDYESIIFAAVVSLFFLLKNAITYLFERGK